MRAPTTLFTQERFHSVKRERIDDAKEEIRNADPDRIAGVEKSEFVDYIVSKYQFEPLEIDWDKAQLDAETFKPDEDYQLIVPFAGTSNLLDYQPSSYSMSFSWQGEVPRGESVLYIDLTTHRGSWNRERLDKEINNAESDIQDYVENLREDIESYHEKLERTVERKVEKRRKEIREQREMIGSIDVPLRQRDDTPDTFAIDTPDKRENISLEPPEPSDASASDPAPTVPDSAYQDILEVVNDVGVGFERSPRIFRELKEEDLRDHVLFLLEQNFEDGSATGETFNREGKSDILLRADDRTNVFVAECAIWGGEKYFTGKIDQLYRYLTWRDTKAAVIMFVQNKQMEPVREQIVSGAENHELFVEKAEQPDESWWQYRFQFKDDPDRELDLAVLAFHIPPAVDS